MTDAQAAILARTVYGEARGCGAAGMKHVASTVMNRVRIGGWWGSDVIGVCKQPWQFSCWNSDDPNLPKLLAVTETDPEYAIALSIAYQAISNALTDQTNGADSYFALSMKKPPFWAATAKRTFVDGWHAFYRTIPIAQVRASSIPNISVHSPVATAGEAEADRLMDLYNPKSE